MKIYIASVLLLPAVAGFQLAPTRVTRAVHPLNAAGASYAEAIESDRIVLRRAAETKNEESDAVVDALTDGHSIPTHSLTTACLVCADSSCIRDLRCGRSRSRSRSRS